MPETFRLRQLAKRAIRGAYWLWTRRLEAAAIQMPRSDYKRTWQHLSESENDAKMFVASTTDETTFKRSAEYTRELLDRFVGLRPSDVVLEIDITSTLGWTMFSDAASYPPKERPSYLPMLSSADELRVYGTKAGFAKVAVEQYDDAWVALIASKG